MRFVILHYHIFKNAGSTIENILDRNFGERFTRFESNHRDGRIDNAELLDHLHNHPHLEAVSSHHFAYPVPAVPGFLFFDLCFLRDPIDRIRSIYDYARLKPSPGDPVNEAANRLSLRNFVEHLLETKPAWVGNVQTKLLAGEGDDDKEADRAAQRVRHASFLGVVDEFEKSVVAGTRLLDPLFPRLTIEEPAVNVSNGFAGSLAARQQQFEQDCGASLCADLTCGLRLDTELVALARREVNRRYEQALAH